MNSHVQSTAISAIKEGKSFVLSFVGTENYALHLFPGDKDEIESVPTLTITVPSELSSSGVFPVDGTKVAALIKKS